MVKGQVKLNPSHLKLVRSTPMSEWHQKHSSKSRWDVQESLWVRWSSWYDIGLHCFTELKGSNCSLEKWAVNAFWLYTTAQAGITRVQWVTAVKFQIIQCVLDLHVNHRLESIEMPLDYNIWSSVCIRVDEAVFGIGQRAKIVVDLYIHVVPHKMLRDKNDISSHSCMH